MTLQEKASDTASFQAFWIAKQDTEHGKSAGKYATVVSEIFI